MEFPLIGLVILLVILSIRQRRIIRQMAYVTLQTQIVLKHLDVAMPKTLSEVLSQYNLPNVVIENVTRYLENHRPKAARKLLQKDSDLSKVEIENIILFAKALNPTISFLE